MTRRDCVLSLLSAAALLPGCGGSERRADLVFTSPSEPGVLDPALVSDQASGRVVTSLFEGLMRWNEAGQAVPGLAEGPPQISADKLVYTFRLRPGLQWSNGDPVTVHDLIASWRRVLDPATGADYQNLLYYIKGAAAFGEGKGRFEDVALAAPDDRTLVITLESPTPFFTDLCAFMTLCPVHLKSLAEHGRDAFKPGKLVCNGAYTLAEWRINYRLRLEKNPRYWDAANVRLPLVELRTIVSATTALNHFLTKSADLALDKDGVPVTLVDKLKTEPWFHLGPFLGTNFIRFNCTRAPFTDARVRLAFALCIDRDLLVTKITRMGEPAAYSLTPPGTGANFQPERPAKMHDIDRARQLLAEAGFPGGKNFPLVRYLYPSRDLDNSLAVELQSMWESVLGIQVLPVKQEWKVYLASQKKLDYDLCRSSWVGDYNDPNTFLEQFTSGSGNNRTGWASPAYDALIAAAAREPDDPRRLQQLAHAEALVCWQETPVTPVYHYTGIQFYRPDEIGGVQANLIDEHPFRCMFRKK